MVSGAEASDQRGRGHEVFFFLFVLLDNLVTSSLRYQVSRNSTILSLPLPSRPRPPWDPPSRSPPAVHGSPTGGHGTALPWATATATAGPATRAGVCSFRCFVFSQHANRERSQDQLTDRYKAKRQRDSGVEAGRRGDGVGLAAAPGAGPRRVEPVSSPSPLGRTSGRAAFTRTRAGGGSRLSPSHCP